MHLKLVRLKSDNEATMGMLLVNGQLFANTMERPWVNNETSISCIPTGNYTCKKRTSTKHGKTLVVENVPTRTDILFHIGNWARDSEGCILLGDAFKMSGQSMIMHSTSAMLRFKEIIKDETKFSLEVVNASGM